MVKKYDQEVEGERDKVRVQIVYRHPALCGGGTRCRDVDEGNGLHKTGIPKHYVTLTD